VGEHLEITGVNFASMIWFSDAEAKLQCRNTERKTRM